MWTGTVRLDFAALVTQRRGVFFAEQNVLANVFERSPVPFEKLAHRQAVSVAVHVQSLSFVHFNTLPAKAGLCVNG